MNKNRNYKNNNKGTNDKYNKGRNNKGKYDKRNRTQESNVQEVGEKELPNNPKWYFLSDEVKKQCSQLAFQEIQGLTKPLNEEIPNIVRLYTNPSPGVQSSLIPEKSGFNAAMFRFYSQLAAFTGRSQQYAPQDVGLVILALGEIVSMFEFVRRIFGISAVTNERNYSYPRYIVESMGVDAMDFQKHRANYRDRFNFLLTRFNALPIPGDIAYIQKCLEIYQNVYLDDPSALATAFVYLPASTWAIKEDYYDAGAFLETISVCLTVQQGSQMAVRHRTMEEYLDIIEQQLDRLQNSTMWAVIYSDLLNYTAKAGMRLLKLDELANNYVVMPSYNLEALMQLKHVNIMTCPYMCKYRPHNGPSEGEDPNIPITAYNDVWPNVNTNEIIYNPLFHTDVDGFRHDFMLSLPTPNPSDDLVLEATRFMASYGNHVEVTLGDVAYVGNANSSLPDHYVVYMEITGNGENTIERLSSNDISFEEVSAATVRALSKVTCAPFLYLHSSGVAAGTIGDYQFYTNVPETWVDKLIKNVALGLYVVR